MMTVNVVAVCVIVLWAFWCMLYRRVSDGVLGKILYFLLILAALGVLSRPGQQSEVWLNVTFAAIGIRHAWMKVVYPHLVRVVVRRARCADCPHKSE